jgi:hypothetical protein
MVPQKEKKKPRLRNEFPILRSEDIQDTGIYDDAMFEKQMNRLSE